MVSSFREITITLRTSRNDWYGFGISCLVFTKMLYSIHSPELGTLLILTFLPT